MNVHGGELWKFTAIKGGPSVYFSHPPCWFHRLMQRWLLGFRWSKE